MPSSKNANLTASDLVKTFASQATTHGLRKILETQRPIGKFIWALIFLTALAGCSYHCSFLIQKYLRFGKVTTTEEIHAKQLQFPALTVCNMNILKNTFLKDQMEKNKKDTYDRKKGFCYESEASFINESEAKDLSDGWTNLGVTLDHLKEYGHQVYDLIVQCSYNAKDCFNESITETLPLETENITITDYLSTRLGFCHTIKLNQSTLGMVKRTGQTLGLTLTLNIERDLYWNLLSPEYGVRILIHPREAYPTIDRGGLVLHPGTKTYLSIRIREILRLPAPYGDCTKSFKDSPLSSLLKGLEDDYLSEHEYYTYEFCHSLCRESHLYNKCKCVEEQVNSSHKFCNPCDSKEEECKETFRDEFDSKEDNPCTDLCKPACEDTRYDITSSTSEWPNMEFQKFVLQRWPDLTRDFTQNNTDHLNETYLNRNFLRVHIFIQEMNFLKFTDIEAYSLPELFADLGGCLGLYIGVSVISIIEFQELLLSIVSLFYAKMSGNVYSDGSKVMKKGSQSRSADEMIAVPRRPYGYATRPEEPTPPVFYIRAKKRSRNSGNIRKLADVESLFVVNNSTITGRRFRKWINTIFNKVDCQRIKDVGPDRAAAEWLLRCGASVKWQNNNQWITDYNEIDDSWDNKNKIVEIDATDSCIMNIGFNYLEGLNYLKKIKFFKCIYLEDKCLYKLSVTKSSLQHLELVSCGNISDDGITSISALQLLKTLYLYDLPEVKNREQCISILKQKLPECKIDFPPTTDFK